MEVSPVILSQLIQIALKTEAGSAVLGAYIEGILENSEDKNRKFTTQLKDGKLRIEFLD